MEKALPDHIQPHDKEDIVLSAIPRHEKENKINYYHATI